MFVLTWLTAFRTICSFWRCPSSDWVTSGTSSIRPVNFSSNLCKTWPSYKSSSMSLTMIRSLANSSFTQSIRMLISSLTAGSFNDCGWIMARDSLSPVSMYVKMKIQMNLFETWKFNCLTITYAKYSLQGEILVHLASQARRSHVDPLLVLLELNKINWKNDFKNCVGHFIQWK